MEKIKKILFKIFCYLFDVYGLLKSVFTVLFKGIKTPQRFFGYYSFWFASKYANKRKIRWKQTWDCTGRDQYVFPFEDESLIVCSKMELKLLKKRKIISRNISIRKATKNSYYKANV